LAPWLSSGDASLEEALPQFAGGSTEIVQVSLVLEHVVGSRSLQGERELDRFAPSDLAPRPSAAGSGAGLALGFAALDEDQSVARSREPVALVVLEEQGDVEHDDRNRRGPSLPQALHDPRTNPGMDPAFEGAERLGPSVGAEDELRQGAPIRSPLCVEERVPEALAQESHPVGGGEFLAGECVRREDPAVGPRQEPRDRRFPAGDPAQDADDQGAAPRGGGGGAFPIQVGETRERSEGRKLRPVSRGVKAPLAPEQDLAESSIRRVRSPARVRLPDPCIQTLGSLDSACIGPEGGFEPHGSPRGTLMILSNRGAARVGVVWLVCVGVLMLVALTFAFITQSDLGHVREALDKANKDKDDAVAQFEPANTVRRDLSRMLGWYDRSSPDPSTDLETAKRYFEETLKPKFGGDLDADKDFENALPKVLAAYDARGAKIAELETRAETLTSEIQAAQSALSSVQQEKDRTIADLRSQLADEQQNAANRQKELEGRLSGQQQLVADRDSELRSVRDGFENAQRGWNREKNLYEARIANLVEMTGFARPEFASNADGTILDVSRKLSLAWIDIGANQRLTTGTRFRVQGGPAGNRHDKAWAEVTQVESNRAEVSLSSLVDTFDPVVKGDVVVNPLYDPKGERNAVLAGRFSGIYGKEELVALLQRIGVNVQDDLDYTTHFLIVGSELYNDPVTNEPLEEPLAPSELAVYKDAVAKQVKIVPLQDIREFFRLGQ